MDVMMRRRELMGMQGRLKTVSGPIVTVNDALARNAKSLIVNFAPVQASGTPAPDNVLPISGWTGVTGYRAGKNLLDPNAAEYYNYTIGPTGEEITSTDDRICTGYIPCGAGISVTASGVEKWRAAGGGVYVSFSFVGIAYYTNEKVFISRVFANSVDYITGTTPANTAYIRFFMQYYSHSNPTPAIFETLKTQLELGATPTTYTPYTGTTIPVDWTDAAGTVYGGHVDLVSGVLTVDRVKWSDNGAAGWNMVGDTFIGESYTRVYTNTGKRLSNTVPMLCNYLPKGSFVLDANKFALDGLGLTHVILANELTGVVYGTDTKQTVISKFKAYFAEHPIEFVYYTYTPITYQLTPQTIAMLRGTNNVWSNANGNVSLIYYAQ